MSSQRNELTLNGCQPTPLASYLKGLGVLRLVSLQADSSARGFWRDDRFCLETQLDREQLVEFFLERYEPSPIVGPWGARSGFFPGSSENSARAALDRIVSSDNTRLAVFRTTIGGVKELLGQLGIRQKDDVGDRKFELLVACRAQLPDDVLPWLDATFVLLEEESKYPPLLGTGGNEGSGSYMSGFAQQIVDVVVERKWDAALTAALFDDRDCDLFTKQTPGHFSPEAAGGPNASSGFDGDVQTNAWEYLLTVEGTLVFAATAARKLESSTGGTLSYPFCVRQTGAGYGSAAASDEKDSRAEMWLPLWTQPCDLSELSALFGEGRANVGRRRARTGTDFARAVATLGIDRGISEFERYGFQVRNGLSTFAVPLGRFHVQHQPHAELLNEIDHWLDRFRSKAAGDQAPASIARALRQLENAVFALCHNGNPESVRRTLIALGTCEAALARSHRWSVDNFQSPIPPLSPRWLQAASRDAPAEFAIAAGLASIEPAKHAYAKLGRLRQHLEPVRLYQHQKQARSNVFWLDPGGRYPSVVWGGGSLIQNLAATLRRRCVEAIQLGVDTEVVTYPDSCRWPVALGHVTAFLNEELDDNLIDQLLWGLTLIDWVRVPKQWFARGRRYPLPLGDYALLKLCHAGVAVRGATVRLEPAIGARLAAGDLQGAVELAARRLRATGAPPSFDSLAVTQSGPRCERLLAALLLPIATAGEEDGKSDFERLFELVLEARDESLDETLQQMEE